MSADTAQAIKEYFPDIDWEKFEEMDRALNWELWHGPLPSNYWTEVEPLELYEWRGYAQAEKDIRELLEPLPHRMWKDCDSDCVTDTSPEDFEDYWEEIDGEMVWIGGEWTEIDPRRELMYVESWKQVF